MPYKFSIITVTYNSENTIEQTIKSVLSQTYQDIEYIIVDGASTDNTKKIIERYSELDGRIRYISEKDNGIYDAMNKGIKMASGDVISLLNSDDYYEADAIEKIARCIPEENNYVIYGMVRFLKRDTEMSVIMHSHYFLPERMMMHPACFVSKNVYKEYLYDTRYKSAADYDLFLRLFMDKNITFIPTYAIIANFRVGGMSSNAISYLETNDIKYKYGYINKKWHFINKNVIRLKNCLRRLKK